MINCRPILHLPQRPPIFRSNHNLISFLKNPKCTVKSERATKSVSKDELNNAISPKNPTRAAKESRANKSVLNDSNEEVLRKLPKEFHSWTKMNTKLSHRLYLINEKTAEIIAQHLTQSVDKCKTIVETNPGPGLLTNLLVERGMSDLRLFENQPEFVAHLQETFAGVHPDRVKLKDIDLVALNRARYGSKRTAEMLSQLPSTDWKDDINFRLFCATGSMMFLSILMQSIVFRSGIMALGRCELYMVMPSMMYMMLTSCNTSMGFYYRATSVFFQIFFEYQILDRFQRTDFLPNVKNTSFGAIESCRRKKGIQISKVDPESMYFVKIVPRRDLYEWLPSNQIQELWHFTQLMFHSRQSRIIQLLENILPGCGARLLLNYEIKEPVRPQRTHTVDLFETPPTTNPSMTLSDRDYGNLNIFTFSGDLQPSEMLTLFREFRMMPEYSSCSFLPSLEGVLLKRGVKSDDEETENQNSAPQR